MLSLSGIGKRGRMAALCGFFATAIVVSAVAPLLAAPAPEPVKKEEPKKEAPPKQAAPEIPFPFPDVDKLFPPGAIDPEQMKELQKAVEEIQKRMAQQLKQLPGAPGALPGIVPGGRRGIALGNRLRPGADSSEEGRMGASIQEPHPTLVDQLNLPEKQGIVLKEVRPDSAASKAGLKNHDILLELDGKPVPSAMDDYQKLLKEIKPDSTVDVVVLRKGKRETIKGLKLPEAKEEAAPPIRVLPRIQILPGNLPLPGGRLPVPVPVPGNIQGNAQIKVNNVAITKNADGSFTAAQDENGVKLTISGKTVNGATQVDEIQVNDGKAAKKYTKVEDVPEAQREAVKNLIQSIEGRGAIQFNFQAIP